MLVLWLVSVITWISLGPSRSLWELQVWLTSGDTGCGGGDYCLSGSTAWLHHLYRSLIYTLYTSTMHKVFLGGGALPPDLWLNQWLRCTPPPPYSQRCNFCIYQWKKRKLNSIPMWQNSIREGLLIRICIRSYNSRYHYCSPQKTLLCILSWAQRVQSCSIHDESVLWVV